MLHHVLGECCADHAGYSNENITILSADDDAIVSATMPGNGRICHHNNLFQVCQCNALFSALWRLVKDDVSQFLCFLADALILLLLAELQ